MLAPSPENPSPENLSPDAPFTPRAPEPRIRYHPNVVLIIVWLVTIVALLIVRAALVPLPSDINPAAAPGYTAGYRVGEMVGRSLPLIVIPLLFSYVGFRLARRSNRVANIALFLVFGFMATGAGFAISNDRHRAMNASLKSMEDHLQRMRSSFVAGDQQGAFDSSVAGLQDARKAEALARGDDKIALEVLNNFNASVQGSMLTVQAKMKAFVESGGLKVTDAVTTQDLDARLALVDAADQANTAAFNLLSGADATIDQELTRRQYPAEKRQSFMRTYKTVLARFAPALQIRQADTRMLAQFHAALTILKDNRDHWTAPEGKLTFAVGNAQLITDYNACLAAIKQAGKDETDAQAELAKQMTAKPGRAAAAGSR